MKTPTHSKNNSGFTLIEIMIATTIAMVLLFGALYSTSETLNVVREGDAVHAGATNLGARLVLRVEATGARTRIGALMARVQDALSRRPPLVEIADRISRVFVLAVLVLAVVTGAVWLGRSAGAALEHVIALLVVTCPCALGLATPVAMTVGLSRAARAGFFI